MREIVVYLAVADDVFDGVSMCCPFFSRNVFVEILDLIESVSESLTTYSCGSTYNALQETLWSQ